jgi:hypothetical protein
VPMTLAPTTRPKSDLDCGGADMRVSSSGRVAFGRR